MPDRHYTHESLDSQLEELEAWIASLGISAAKSDRFHHVRTVVQRGARALREEMETGDPAYMRAIGDYVFALTEALEFCSVYEAFKNSPRDKIKPKLALALSGPPRFENENEKNSLARNTMFELFLAADWKLNGLDVALGDPDITLRLEGHVFLVECKRPNSRARLYDNLRAARSQLRRKLEKSRNTHGIIAMSISRIVNPDNRFFLCQSMNDKPLLGDRMDTVLRQERQQIVRLAPDPAYCGIIYHASAPVDVGPGKHFALMGFYVFHAALDMGAHILNRKLGPLYADSRV